ncbi:Protein transport protein SEC31 [Lasiodiplodia hormozganensis]|uniref:Protein transport protein SEC31 n=1 Tax=Lasiodiplodia hormozganensis TaxID=869390 RepID=A0AA39YCJ3_9PEZI|nr:Protein transport protein SEC31 [Lasiodiplodia hormozganensis]
MASPLALGRRDISGTIDGVKESFSSWDACMSKAYCKWPVIAGIAIAGIIIFSILWCCGRCLCCGAECCCSCLSCCNKCCPGPRKGHRRVESPPPAAFPNNQQYQSAPPMYAGPGWNQDNTPQYATFDVSSGDKKFNEDALPAMPTWETAKSTKVEVHEEQVREHPDDMEMKKLDMKPGGSPTNSSVGPSPVNSRSPAPPSEYGLPVQPRPIHPANSNFVNDFKSPSPYQSEFNAGQDQPAYFNGQPQQPYGMQRHASPAPYQDQNQPYHYANDPYGQQAYGYDHGAAPYGQQQYDTASSVGGYAPSQAPTGYAPSGSTRYEPSMHNAYQDPYQRGPPPPMPPIDRAGTASPYQSYGQPPRPPVERAATASPYQPFNNAPRPPVERSATGSPWERFGANRNPAGY